MAEIFGIEIDTELILQIVLVLVFIDFILMVCGGIGVIEWIFDKLGL